MCIHVIYWYHFYLNHPVIIRGTNNILQICYWKGLVSQAELLVKTCNKCQQFKNRKTIYRQLSPKIIPALKPWNSMHRDLVGTHSKSIRQQQPDGAIIKNYLSLT